MIKLQFIWIDDMHEILHLVNEEGEPIYLESDAGFGEGSDNLFDMVDALWQSSSE